MIENDIPAIRALWPSDGEIPGFVSALDLIRDHKVSLVVNVPKNFSHGELTNGYKIRRSSIDFNVPLITNARLATAYIRAFCTLSEDQLAIKSWDEYR